MKILKAPLILSLFFLSLLTTSGALASVLPDSVRTDIQTYNTKTDGQFAVYTIYEGHVGQDLNGDGDLWDQLLAFFDATTGTQTITSVVSSNSNEMLMNGETVILRVYEYQNGVDYNGNGSLYDTVMISFNLVTQQATYLPVTLLYGPFYEIFGDLDGDNFAYIDTQRNVRIYNLATGTNTLVGSSSYYQVKIDGDNVLYTISEWQTGTDINGDGDTWDTFWQIHNLTSGHTTVFSDGYVNNAYISGKYVVLQVPEAGTDMNGNGYPYDLLPFLYNINTETRTLIPSMDGHQLDIEGNLISGRTSEYFFGDLNGDGDTNDTFIAFYDIANEQYHLTDHYIYGRNDLGSMLFTFLTSEYRDNVDYNGDGDKWDAFLTYYDVAELVGTGGSVTLADLPDVVKSMDIPHGNMNALLATIEGALRDLDKGKTKAAQNKLEATLNKVEAQRGKKISDYEADELILIISEIMGDL